VEQRQGIGNIFQPYSTHDERKMKSNSQTSPSRKGNKRKKDPKRAVDDLLNIMATLRSPSGCPWDREQTEQTLKAYLMEEAYEAIEAIETGTPEALKEELGDLLLQIVFLSRIAEEKGEFSFSDVVHGLTEKLLRRHPHVFSPTGGKRDKVHVRTAQDVKKVWREVKEREGRHVERTSALDGLPLGLPALERAQKISQRASKAGLEWSDTDDIWGSIEEKTRGLGKVKGRISGRAGEKTLGDVLFLLAHWTRLKGVSAEEALRKATRHFAKRFQKLEKQWSLGRKSPEQFGQYDLATLWKGILKR
jgi:tetrapyrrole methylase family protein / MazG family protein